MLVQLYLYFVISRFHLITIYQIRYFSWGASCTFVQTKVLATSGSSEIATLCSQDLLLTKRETWHHSTLFLFWTAIIHFIHDLFLMDF